MHKYSQKQPRPERTSARLSVACDHPKFLAAGEEQQSCSTVSTSEVWAQPSCAGNQRNWPALPRESDLRDGRRMAPHTSL
eukprot:4303892-Amphidinium_carterae.1